MRKTPRCLGCAQPVYHADDKAWRLYRQPCPVGPGSGLRRWIEAHDDVMLEDISHHRPGAAVQWLDGGFIPRA